MWYGKKEKRLFKVADILLKIGFTLLIGFLPFGFTLMAMGFCFYENGKCKMGFIHTTPLFLGMILIYLSCALVMYADRNNPIHKRNQLNNK